MRSTIATTFTAPLALMGLLIIASTSAGLAHEGHDHGAQPSPVPGTVAPRAETSSTDFELVLIARGPELTIYLDTFKDNAPVSGAEIEIDTPSGLLKPKAMGPGIYAVTAPVLAKPGTYDLAITVSANGAVDVLTTTLKIPESSLATADGTVQRRWWFSAPAVAQGLKHRATESDPSFWLTLVMGFGAGVLATVVVLRRRGATSAAATLAFLLFASHIDTAKADGLEPVALRDASQRFADGTLFVPKPTQRILALRTLLTEDLPHRRSLELPGRIIPNPNASGLVQASVGGRLSPPSGGFKPLGTAVKAGEILAFVRPPLPSADATVQQQQARELDQQISIVSRKVQRLTAIQQVIARSQLEDAELELKGLQARRANLDRVNREPEPLLAPVNGVIAASNAVAGQMAESNSIIFQIVDPAQLWIEALSFEPQATNSTAQALFVGGRTVDLTYVGTGLADRNQAVPIQFSIRGDTSGLRAGQFVTVLASTAEERRGIAVPREAILRGPNGQSIVYEHTNAERFVIRDVRVEPLDGTRVVIVAGIEPGKRIVTQGAELLNQIR